MITLYKNINNTDVAFEEIKRVFIKNKDIFEIQILWWNIVGSHEPFCMNIVQEIRIPFTEYYTNWERLEISEWQDYY